MGIFSFLFGCGHAPAPANFQLSDELLFVRGWTKPELQKVIADFSHMYSDRLPADFSTAVESGDHGALQVSFPHDIEPRLFCWLINYVQYPKDFDLRSRSIVAAGVATIQADFLPASGQSQVGKRILLYVPAHDTEHDLVFGRVDAQSYEYPFSSEQWRRVDDSRLPDAITKMTPPNQAMQRTAR